MKTVRGAQVKLPFFGLYRFEKGKLARAWVFYQSAVLVKQASGTSGTE